MDEKDTLGKMFMDMSDANQWARQVMNPTGVVSSAKGKDAYFVNMSDGMRYYDNYSGEAAWNHTRAQVKNMTKEGIKVISYFITGSHGIHDSERSAFNAMYGKDSQYIDTKKINEVAKSMNSKFLEVA